MLIFLNFFEKFGLFGIRNAKSQLSTTYLSSKRPLIKTQGIYAKMTDFAHFTMFSNIADFDTNVTFSYHVLSIFCFDFSFKCFKIKVLMSTSVVTLIVMLKRPPPPSKYLLWGF